MLQNTTCRINNRQYKSFYISNNKKNEKNHTYKFANNSEFDFLCSDF